MTSAMPTHYRVYNNASPMTETVYSAKNGSLNKQRSLIYASLSQRRDMAQPVPIKAFLQSAKVAAMCTAPRAETSPPPPIPTFFASTKPIFKMDCAN